MGPEQLGPIVGMIFIIVTGLVFVSYFYFRSRERQLMIDKGMSTEQIAELLKGKRNPYSILKMGVITILFGLGLGIGIGLQDADYGDFWITLLLFTFTGIGFVLAFFVSRKYEKEDGYISKS